jgi:hypothetical protein
MNKTLLILLSLTLLSCRTYTSDIKKEIAFSGQEFDLKLFEGKWLTNSRTNKNHYRIFRKDFNVEYSDKTILSYELKKDSIFIYGMNRTFIGRLIHLDKQEVYILWGNQEAITYYRP